MKLAPLIMTALFLAACNHIPWVDAPDGGADSSLGTAPPRPTCIEREAKVTGTVYAPNGVDPVPGATVFVPSTTPELFPPAVSCEVCGKLGQATNFWFTTAAYDGTFTLEGVCPGKRTVVVQNGRFRRMIDVDVAAGATISLPAAKTRLPRRTGEFSPGDAIPHIAVATGDYDKMECVLRKLGLGPGSFDLYEGARVLASPTTKLTPFSSLVSDLEKMKRYNIIFINCTDNTFEAELNKKSIRDNIAAYVKAGGRLYVTDWSYDWVEQIEALSGFVDFEPGASTGGTPEKRNGASIGADKLKVAATIKDERLRKWLGVFPGVFDADGKVHIEHFFAGWTMIHKAAAGAKVWVEGDARSRDGKITGVRPLTLTFNFENCGKILFSSYHTEGRDDEHYPTPKPKAYPGYCSGKASPQDRILEYLIFDIASCVSPVQ